MKKALVTGASGGIGGAAARRLKDCGYFVFLNYFRSRNRAEELAEELNVGGGEPSAAVVRADVSNRAQVEAMFAMTGGVDVLVNNAGIAQQKLFTDITEQEWQRLFDIDVTGVFHCCQCALPFMIHNKAGKIINISSMWGQTGGSCEVHYSAAKAAVIGLTRALAKELGPSNIQVNCIAPGVIRTEMNAGLGSEALQELCEETPLGKIGSPEDIAYTVGFLASEQADFITGQVLGVNGGLVI